MRHNATTLALVLAIILAAPFLKGCPPRQNPPAAAPVSGAERAAP